MLSYHPMGNELGEDRKKNLSPAGGSNHSLSLESFDNYVADSKLKFSESKLRFPEIKISFFELKFCGIFSIHTFPLDVIFWQCIFMGVIKLWFFLKVKSMHA